MRNSDVYKYAWEKTSFSSMEEFREAIVGFSVGAPDIMYFHRLAMCSGGMYGARAGIREDLCVRRSPTT